MRLDDPLNDTFASASHVRLLRALFSLPSDMGASGRDLARRAGVSHPRANQVLAGLAEQGVVAVQRLPRTDLYRVNGHHALAESLRKLFDLEPRLRFQLLALVAGELKGRRLPVKEARIFGSAARGEMKPTSDVDLALVTSRENVAGVEAAAQEIAEKARERFGTRLNVLVGSPSLGRLSKSRQTRQGAWQAIEREGIDVFAAPHATG
ncbi:MAG TPA: nucleotidyltransferase domain-containing protein [Candidatus Dormibacteraeota bacterium]|nr:nucleotidyltransferase domain-containing protein [Candidatus Dormibacteraeota bacterium]